MRGLLAEFRQICRQRTGHLRKQIQVEIPQDLSKLLHLVSTSFLQAVAGTVRSHSPLKGLTTFKKLKTIAVELVAKSSSKDAARDDPTLQLGLGAVSQLGPALAGPGYRCNDSAEHSGGGL